MQSWILTLVIFAPLVGVILLMLPPRGSDASVRRSALFYSLLTLGLTLLALVKFYEDAPATSFGNPAYLLPHHLSWISGELIEIEEQLVPSIDIGYHVGVDGVSIWHILTLSFVTGCAQAFGGPAYQSLIPSLVPKENLPNAVALNSIQFNLARMVGPLLAGVTIATLGYAVCFGINGISYLVVILALMSIRVPHLPSTRRQPMLDELRGGLRYVQHEGALLPLTILAFATTFLALPLLTFLPVIAQEVFQRDLDLYSQMMAFSAAGAVVGGLTVAWLGRFKHMGRTLLLVQIGFGLVLVGFASSRSIWIDFGLLFMGGAALMVIFSLSLSLVQLVAPNELRGRVMSIYLVAFRGGMPLGSLASASVFGRLTATNGA